MLIVLDDMIADMESNKKISPIVPELFLLGRKLSISFFYSIATVSLVISVIP